MTTEAINLSEVLKRIDDRIGNDNLEVPGIANENLITIINSEFFDKFLNRKIYSWVIRTYLANAKIQERITDEQFEIYLSQIKTRQGMEQLAVSILLSSVSAQGGLQQLKAIPVAKSGSVKKEVSVMKYVGLDTEESSECHLSILPH
ncbi:hypothetical protein [Microbulbifer epialgicus]|uniref:Uncharacterized protein n=1 Tax=Microbulbifer epialgicus TaxID=393907 RepID=A0ABV4NUV9_9GAMM